MDQLWLTLGYGVLGLVMLVGSFALIDLLVPGKLWEEILERQNTALAILAAGFALSIAIIVAAVIQ